MKGFRLMPVNAYFNVKINAFNYLSHLLSCLRGILSGGTLFPWWWGYFYSIYLKRVIPWDTRTTQLNAGKSRVEKWTRSLRANSSLTPMTKHISKFYLSRCEWWTLNSNTVRFFFFRSKTNGANPPARMSTKPTQVQQSTIIVIHWKQWKYNVIKSLSS